MGLHLSADAAGPLVGRVQNLSPRHPAFTHPLPRMGLQAGWIMLGPRTTAKHQSLNRSCSKLGTDPFIITPDVRSGYQHSSLQIPHSYFLIYF